MSKAVPSKPPIRPFKPTYAINTTMRVPGQRSAPLTEQVDLVTPASGESDDALA